jgi:hypothetical protein
MKPDLRMTAEILPSPKEGEEFFLCQMRLIQER